MGKGQKKIQIQTLYVIICKLKINDPIFDKIIKKMLKIYKHKDLFLVQLFHH